MDAQTINRTYDLLTPALLDTKLKHAGRFYTGPCPFCGGRDRFNLKATDQGWRWLCRKCTDAKYLKPVDYIMRRENVDFKQALEMMGGIVTLAPRIQAAPKAPEMILPDEAWQSTMWRRVLRACGYLHSISGDSGQIYLADRAISRGTMHTYLLGMDPIKYDPLTKLERPAIVIPWFDIGPAGDVITAIKYRFIDELAADPKHRYIMEAGSVPVLFGVHAAAGHEILILVEGEINAMSIMQVSAGELLHIDALSFGSQSGSRKNVLRKAAREYKRVVVWADDPEKARAIRSSLGRPADALFSLDLDNVKYDASALLKKGWLSGYLHQAIQEPLRP